VPIIEFLFDHPKLLMFITYTITFIAITIVVYGIRGCW